MMVDKKHHSNAGAAIRERVLPQALVLVKSSLLQGQALQVGLLTSLKLQCGGYLIYYVVYDPILRALY